jgi:hypothetical protein
MNHLRELLDTPPLGIGLDSDLDRLIGANAIVRLRKRGEEAQCFFMGEIDSVGALKAVPDLLFRLPYPVTWFETHQENMPGVVQGVLAIEDRDGSIELYNYSRCERSWGLMWVANCVDFSTGEVQVMCRNGVLDADVKMSVEYLTHAVRAFCSAMSCVNVQRHHHMIGPKLQKARAKRGKAPLFSYWTLQLDGKSERGDDCGGTHASPRVHLRRGHPRQYAPGRWTWVQAHAVGNRAAGMVHKDYSAGPALAAAAR